MKNNFKKRISDFFIKIISIKIIIWFGVATVALFMGLLPWVAWLAVSGMCFAARTTEKLLMKYFDRGEN